MKKKKLIERRRNVGKMTIDFFEKTKTNTFRKKKKREKKKVPRTRLLFHNIDKKKKRKKKFSSLSELSHVFQSREQQNQNCTFDD